METSINYLAVLVSAIVSMIIGAIWHGPLFGKQFMKAIGAEDCSPEDQAAMRASINKAYVLQFLSSLLMFFVLAWYIVTSIHTGVYGGIANAFGLWLGFVVPLSASQAIWSVNIKGRVTLFWINIGSMFIILLAAGAIIGGWR